MKEKSDFAPKTITALIKNVFFKMASTVLASSFTTSIVKGYISLSLVLVTKMG